MGWPCTGTYELSVRDTDPDTIPEPDTTPVPQTPPQTQAPADADAVRAGATELGDITGLAGPAFPTGRLDGGADAVDYYRFTLSEAKGVHFGLRQQETNADLILEDEGGVVIASMTTAGTANEELPRTLLAGTYFVRIEAKEAGASTYVFRYGVTAADPEALERLLQEENAGQVPAFGQQDHVLALAENADGSTSRVSLGTVSATDPEGAALAYSVVGGNEAGLFEIDAATGELFYAGSGEDYESGSTPFDLTVRASDGTQSTDTAVTVNVADVDETPTFGHQGYAFDLAENADGGTNRVSLGTVSATDPEGVALAYSLVGGNEAGLFGIDAASGELFYVGAGEDYETGATSFDLTVRASDGDRTTDTGVSVNVTDVAETVEVDPPVTEPDQSTPQTVSEPAGEDFSAATSTSGRVAVGDTATGNIETNRDRDWFAVELVAGRSYTIDLRGSPTGDGTLLDTYLRGIHDADGNVIPGTTNDDGGEGYNSRLTFTATESGTHYIAAGAFSSRGTYEVEVTDHSPPVQEPPAFSQPGYAFDLAENADGGTNRVSLGTVSATDPEGVALAHSLVDGNDAGLFGIDAASGELFYVGSGEDYESGTTQFDLTVRANDGTHSTNTAVTVNVANVDEAPAFGEQDYAFELAENTDGSTQRVSLGIVAAVDPDGTAVEYSLEAGNGSGLFQVEAATGELFYTGPGEDFESGSTPFELTVRASDGTLFTDMTVTVNVTDLPEQAIVEAPVAQTPHQAGATDLGDITGLAGPAFPTGTLDGGADKVDYFRFTLTEAKQIGLGLRQQDTNADLFLEDAEGNVLHSSTEAGTASEWIGETLLAGTYYVRIETQEAGQNDYVFRYGGTAADPDEVARLQAQMETQTEPEALQQTETSGDHSADTDTAGVVTVGGSATDDIGSSGDQDWFAVDLTAGTRYQIDLEGHWTGDGTLGNPYLRGIYDSNRNLLSGTTNDNGGTITNSRMYFEATTDGTYYVAAGSAYRSGAYDTGTYTLSVASVADAATEDDFTADTDTAGMVTVGGSAAGEIETPGDRDWFAVELAAGTRYWIDLKGSITGDGSLWDPYLHGIYDSNGNLLSGTMGDDDGTGQNTRVVFDAATDGTYYVAAGANGTNTGTYRLSVAAIEDDFAAAPSTTGVLTVGGSATGVIEGPDDRDWFAVDLTAGTRYRIDLEGRPTGAGTMWDS